MCRRIFLIGSLLVLTLGALACGGNGAPAVPTDETPTKESPTEQIPTEQIPETASLPVTLEISSEEEGQFAVNINGTDLEARPGPERGSYASPDGQRLAWLEPGGAVPLEATLWLSDADGSNAVEIGPAAREGIPSWSPDGSRLVVDSASDGALLVVNADGSGQRELSVGATAEFRPSVWSPDGAKIAHRGRGPSILVVGADSGELVATIAPPDAADPDQPSWSGDGERLAFTDQGGTFLVNLDGTGVNQLTDDGGSPAFSPDGQYVAFRRSPARVFLVNVETLEETLLFETANSSGRFDDRLVWSPNGRMIAFEAWTGETPEIPETIGFGIYIANADGSRAYQLVDLDIGYGPDVQEIRWLSDERLSFVFRREGPFGP